MVLALGCAFLGLALPAVSQGIVSGSTTATFGTGLDGDGNIDLTDCKRYTGVASNNRLVIWHNNTQTLGIALTNGLRMDVGN